MTQRVEPILRKLVEYLNAGAEHRSLDFKKTIDWSDRKDMLGLIRDCMAMSNNRDGGAVVIGVMENGDGTYSASGMEPAHFDALDPDDVAAQTARYADAPLSVNTIKWVHEGKLFAVVEVQAAERVPTICKSGDGGHNILRDGQIYIRPLGKAETRAIRNYQEMRDLFDQTLEREVERLRELGLIPAIGSTRIETPNFHGFDDEIGDLL